MFQYSFPLVYTLFLWWFSTGVILYLDSLPRRTFPWSMVGATLLLLLSLVGLAVTQDGDSVADAYLAFTCGVLVWGWLEMSYFMGFVTGPRKEPCPPGCTAWRRFRLVIHTSLYHELAILVMAVLVIALTWGETNQVGTWTFMVLWWMRLSSKLNVFLGVPNLNEEWLPEHIRFLTSYVTKKPMNLLFPVSVTVSTVVAVLLVQMALAAQTDVYATGLIMIATLLALGTLEHWFLVLPLPDEALWRWAMPARSGSTPEEPPRAEAAAGAGCPGGKNTLLGAAKSVLANKQMLVLATTASVPLALMELPALASASAPLTVISATAVDVAPLDS